MLRRISPFSDKCKFTVNHSKVNVQRFAVVHVVLVRGLNLPKLNKNGKSSDPYCELSLGKKSCKSKTVAKSVNPEWRETFNFNWYKGIDDILSITPYNKNYGDLPLDDRMGRVEIDLNDFGLEKTHHIWKNIENDGENCGQIFILLTVSGTTGDDSITSLKVIEDDIQRYYELANYSGLNDMIGVLEGASYIIGETNI